MAEGLWLGLWGFRMLYRDPMGNPTWRHHGPPHTVLRPQPVLSRRSVRPAVPSHVGRLAVGAGLRLCISQNRKQKHRWVSDRPRGVSCEPGSGTRQGTLAAPAPCTCPCAGTPGCV